MSKNGLTLTIVFEGSSGNYGEGFGNVSQLKKLTRADGNVYSYISRQALRYNIVQQMNIGDTPVDAEQKVVQFTKSAQIDKYPELDLFGYMKTAKKSDDNPDGTLSRAATVRLSNAVALEPYKSDMDFLTNMGLAKRNNYDNAIAQSEIHKSLYSYTVSVDLDKIGIDGNIEIPAAEKAERVCNLLDCLQFLYRDIRGRRENLNPVFVVGGCYERKNPYFADRIKYTKQGLGVSAVKDVIESCDDTKTNTHVGMISEFFKNDEQLKAELSVTSVSDVFNTLKKEVHDYYA